MLNLSRREFLGVAGAATAAISTCSDLFAADNPLDFPLVDYHVHVEAAPTLEKLVAISRQLGIKFGIVEHAGTRENQYPRILSNDDELRQHIKDLAGLPVYKGVQVEWIDWMTCFSKEAIAELDYALGDAMTVRGKNGQRQKLWEKGVEIDNPQKFMDEYAEFHVEVMATEPIDIMANTSYLPPMLVNDWDTLWTPPRMKKVIDAAVKYNVALEISSSLRLPKLSFLKMAKEAGAKFSFGSNIRGPEVGKLDYCIEMAKPLGLTGADMFVPPPPGKKRIQLRG